MQILYLEKKGPFFVSHCITDPKEQVVVTREVEQRRETRKTSLDQKNFMTEGMNFAALLYPVHYGEVHFLWGKIQVVSNNFFKQYSRIPLNFH